MSVEKMAIETVMTYAPNHGHNEIDAVKTAGKVAAVHYKTKSTDGFIEIVYLAWGPPAISNLTEIARGMNKPLDMGEIRDNAESVTVYVDGQPCRRTKLGMRLL